MSLFDRFLKLTRPNSPSTSGEQTLSLLSQLNPDKFYVENVRSLLDVSYTEAVGILESAVRQGVFVRHIEVLCPDGSMGAEADSEDALPPTIPCWDDDDEGHPEESTVSTKALKKVVFYSLDTRADTTAYAAAS